jgi:hypothetical protein
MPVPEIADRVVDGIEGLTQHALRYTAVSFAIAAGANVKESLSREG